MCGWARRVDVEVRPMRGRRGRPSHYYAAVVGFSHIIKAVGYARRKRDAKELACEWLGQLTYDRITW